MNRKRRTELFVALDTPEVDRARDWIRRIGPAADGFKIGLELYCSGGDPLIDELREAGRDVFVDLKLHDIPNTAAGAAAAIARRGVRYFTVHASGGSEMIRRAAEASAESAAAAGLARPTLLAVTVLTSLDDLALASLGLAGPAAAAAERLTRLAREAGAGGIVCSAHEVAAMRVRFAEGTLVVPGIRPAGAAVDRDDQSRTATPARAAADGADVLVIGRPIVRDADPRAAAQAIRREIDGA